MAWHHDEPYHDTRPIPHQLSDPKPGIGNLVKVAVWQLNMIIFFSGAGGHKAEIQESECWP